MSASPSLQSSLLNLVVKLQTVLENLRKELKGEGSDPDTPRNSCLRIALIQARVIIDEATLTLLVVENNISPMAITQIHRINTLAFLLKAFAQFERLRSPNTSSIFLMDNIAREVLNFVIETKDHDSENVDASEGALENLGEGSNAA